MKIKQKFLMVIPVMAMILFCPCLVFAQDAAITDISVTDGKTELLLSLKMEGAFEKEIEEAVLNGIPATFSFFIRLTQSRTLCPDKTIQELTITHTIKYDGLKNEFRVNQSWKGDMPLTTKSFEEAKGFISEIKMLKLVPLERLQKGKCYQIKAKAQMERKSLPFFLSYVLLTFLWDFETDWHSFTFIY